MEITNQVSMDMEKRGRQIPVFNHVDAKNEIFSAPYILSLWEDMNMIEKGESIKTFHTRLAEGVRQYPNNSNLKIVFTVVDGFVKKGRWKNPSVHISVPWIETSNPKEILEIALYRLWLAKKLRSDYSDARKMEIGTAIKNSEKIRSVPIVNPGELANKSKISVNFILEGQWSSGRDTVRAFQGKEQKTPRYQKAHKKLKESS